MRDERPSSWRTETRGAGFTLIEVIIVLTILGLVMAVVFSGTRGPSDIITLRAAANELAAGLRDVRSRAIEANRPMDLTLDLGRHRWQIGNGPETPLPPKANVELVTLAGQIRAADFGVIRFEPDGSSSGGRIELIENGHRITVGIDWITGRVLVGNAH
jgi:general secretion pathway protein H